MSRRASLKRRLIERCEARAAELEREAERLRFYARGMRGRGSGPLPYYERVVLADELEVER